MRQRDIIVAGLDIGTTKVCALAVEVTPMGGLQARGFGQVPSEGMRKGVVVNIEKTVGAVRRAVSACEHMCGSSLRSVHAGIAGQHVRSTNEHGMVAVRTGTVTEDDIKRTIESAQAINIPNDREVLHILPRDFIVDDQDGVQNPLGMSGMRLEVDVHIVTCSATSGQNIVKCCNLAGLEAADIALEPLASAQAVLNDDERELGVALLDIGGGTTDIAIYSEGNLVHTAVLAVGGNHITHDVAVGLRTPLPEAELIKHEHGVAMRSMVPSYDSIQVPSVGGRRARNMDRGVLAGVIEERLCEIFELVDQEIQGAGCRGLIASGVVLTGGSALLKGIDELAAKVMQVPARVGYPREISGLDEVIHSPMYATVIGLLHHAQSQGEPSYAAFMIRDHSLLGRASRRMRDWVGDLF